MAHRSTRSPPPVVLKPLRSSELYARRRRHSTDSSSKIRKDEKQKEALTKTFTPPYNVTTTTTTSSSSSKTAAHRAAAPSAPSAANVGAKGPPPKPLGPTDETSHDMSLPNVACSRCGDGFMVNEPIVNSGGEVWHQQCFVCAQCFQPFPDGIFYEFEGRKYCEHDFHVLFAPCCSKCGDFIVGRVIKAMNGNWHPRCFRCESCNVVLAEVGFLRHAGRALCRDCHAVEKAAVSGRYICHKCRAVIDEGHIKYKGEVYHPYHFNCKNCEVELKSDAREVKGELYCLRCHDKMGVPICGACRRPIEERVVTALGKHWHVEHFVCAKCEKPFLGTRHYEKRGLAYCEIHFHQLFGNVCYVCNNVVIGDVFQALKKSWCMKCFACSFCDKKMDQKTKFYEIDMKPVCKKCYEKFPQELKARLTEYSKKTSPKKHLDD